MTEDTTDLGLAGTKSLSYALNRGEVLGGASASNMMNVENHLVTGRSYDLIVGELSLDGIHRSNRHDQDTYILGIENPSCRDGNSFIDPK